MVHWENQEILPFLPKMFDDELIEEIGSSISREMESLYKRELES